MIYPARDFWLPWSSESLPPGSLDLLNALRDIREPAVPGFWPPAPGWWLLAAGLLVMAIMLVWRAWRRRQRQRPIRRALEELQRWQTRTAGSIKAGTEAEAASELAALLKRAALTRYPRQTVARLSGDAWLAFLDRSGDTDRFSRGAGRALGDLRYAPVLTFDPDALAALARQWLQRHLDGPRPASGRPLTEAAA
ncbi:MAG: DUF4381 domain-containing protein [Gammaproteobacteria bacterium]|nr:DUF4381 domain-containing protein [Gammaproteobacteria bacterium]